MKNFVKVNTEEEFRTLMAAFDAADICWMDGEKAPEFSPTAEPCFRGFPIQVGYNTEDGDGGFFWENMGTVCYNEKETTMARFLKKLEIIKLKKQLAMLPKEEK